MMFTVTKVYQGEVDLMFEAASAEEAYERAAKVYIDNVEVNWRDDPGWYPKVFTNTDLEAVGVVGENTPNGEFEIWRDF